MSEFLYQQDDVQVPPSELPTHAVILAAVARLDEKAKGIDRVEKRVEELEGKVDDVRDEVRQLRESVSKETTAQTVAKLIDKQPVLTLMLALLSTITALSLGAGGVASLINVFLP